MLTKRFLQKSETESDTLPRPPSRSSRPQSIADSDTSDRTRLTSRGKSPAVSYHYRLTQGAPPPPPALSSQPTSGYNSSGQVSPGAQDGYGQYGQRGATQQRMFKAGAQLLMSPYEQVKSYQRQFDDDAYDIAAHGLLEKILELNELLTSRKLNIQFAPKVDSSALKDCPDNLIELMTVVEELYTDAAETLRKIRTWLCTMTIKASGAVPDEVVNCVTQGIDSCWHVLKKNIEGYHFQRAERAAKYMTYPQLEDYKLSMAYLDRMHWVELRDNIVLLRDRYLLTHDMIEKYVLTRGKRRSELYN